MDYIILKEASLALKKPTGKTSHIAGNSKLPAASKLQIVQYFGDEGFYLFHLNEDNEVITDTYHSSIDDALEQADWEYDLKFDEWKNYFSG